MKANFNNMRKNLTSELNILRNILDNAMKENDLEDYEDDIKEHFNEVSYAVGSINCLYDDSIKDDVDDLSNLECFRFKT